MEPQVTDPIKAATFLKAHDEAVAHGQLVHRVTQYLAGSGGGLRQAMEAHAAGQGMSVELRAEVTAYSLCLLDDTVVEAVHRDVSHISARAPAATVAYRAATMRLAQNLRALDSGGVVGRQKFATFFRNWKSVAQTKSARARACERPRRMAMQKFFQTVYRYGQDSLRDWGFLQAAVQAHLAPLDSNQRAGASARLKADFISLAFVDGGIYTLANPPEAAVAAALLLPIDQAGKAMDEATQEPVVIEVLDLAVKRKKQVQTASAIAIRRMSVPASLQHYGIWNAGTYPGQSQEVYPDGCPQVLDLLCVSPWPVLRTTARQWDVQPSDVAGCVRLTQPALVMDRQWDLRHQVVPVVILLDRLTATGWAHGAPPALHTKATARVFRMADVISCRSYLQCLLVLEELQASGLPGLRSDQVTRYYTTVLADACPAAVPLDLAQAEYSAWASGREPAKRPTPPSSEEDAPIVRLAGPAHGKAAPAKPAAKPAAAPGPAASGPCALWRPLVKAAAPPPPPTVTAGHCSSSSSSSGTPAGQEPSAGSAGPAGRAANPASPRPGADETSAGDFVVHPRPRVARPKPITLEGCTVTEDSHGQPGQPGYYKRYIVNCPLACTGHSGARAPCCKRRGCGPAQCSSFGDMEPFAFLGAWLAAAPRYADRGAHMEHVPSGRDVEAYMRSQNWM